MKKITIARLLTQVLEKEGYTVTFRRWTGKNYVTLGQCFKEGISICLSYNRFRKMSKTERRTVFLHELVHAYLEITATSFGEDFFHPKDEEVVADAIAYHLDKTAKTVQKEKLDDIIEGYLKKADKEFEGQ